AALDGQSRTDRVTGAAEGGEHRVSLATGLDQEASVLADCRVEDRVMARQGRAHGRRVDLPLAGGGFEVGEEERDGSRRGFSSRFASELSARRRAVPYGIGRVGELRR